MRNKGIPTFKGKKKSAWKLWGAVAGLRQAVNVFSFAPMWRVVWGKVRRLLGQPVRRPWKDLRDAKTVNTVDLGAWQL